MGYNKSKELKEWQRWKNNEEELLRKLGVKESVIAELYDFDYKAFKTERNIRSRQFPVKETFFLNIPTQESVEINTIEDLLENIENEVLFAYLSKTDQITLNIILLKILGYSTSEISKITNISSDSIYKRIQRLKKKFI